MYVFSVSALIYVYCIINIYVCVYIDPKIKHKNIIESSSEDEDDLEGEMVMIHISLSTTIISANSVASIVKT